MIKIKKMHVSIKIYQKGKGQ